MEEIVKTEEAYYSKLPAAVKQKAKDLFEKIDTDGNGTITYEEYRSLLESTGIGGKKVFDLFDGDGNGTLDFNEFLGWHYMMLTGRFATCDGCRMIFPGVFFSCSECFYSEKTYELCHSCYINWDNISHQHSADMFLDNYALLFRTRNIVVDHKKKQQQDQGKVVALQRGTTLGNVAAGASIASSGTSIAINVLSMCSQM